ncbi:MAG: outer membrane protein transport protein [Alphaproteobacteria bacterium]|nr:outer membrane protein transport protein [Alphaproteobacteria bacterium]
MKKISVAAAVALLASVGNADAAGYQLNEFSVTNLGRSFAGIGVAGDDYSALGYNPAGMTLMKRSGMQAGLTMTEVASKIRGVGNTAGKKTDMDFMIPLPSMFGQYNVNDKLFLGAGIYVPFGLATRYGHDSFVAKDENGVRRSELEVVDGNISAAYKVDNHLSLGVSGILRHIKGKLTSNVNKYGYSNLAYSDFKVSGWSTTMNVGAMYEFDEDTRVGLAYRFKSTQRTTGHHTVTLNPQYAAMASLLNMQDVNRYDSVSDPELPASWILSGYHKFGEKWGTTATVKYTQWHRFYVFPAYSSGTGNLDVQYRWKDAWNFALGQDYYLNENWTLRAGLAWDQSPVPNSTYRTNRIPDTDRLWTSFGVSYATGNHQFDFGYAHLFMMHGKVWNSAEKDTNAKYKSYSNMYALQYQYKF